MVLEKCTFQNCGECFFGFDKKEGEYNQVCPVFLIKLDKFVIEELILKHGYDLETLR